MPDLDKPSLLAAWLEGNMTPQQRSEFEQACSEDPEFSLQVETANMAMMDAEHYQQESVPDWQRESTFSGPEKQSWWQWQALPAMSFCTSMIAIVMVVTGFQVKVNDGAMTISLAKGVDESSMQAMVDERMHNFKSNQQELLTQYTQQLQKQQLETNTQLTNYLLSSSRQERREDFAELIKFVNEQRSDDQMFYARQLNKIQDEIYSLPEQVEALTAPYDDRIQN